MNILAPISVGELFDKITILEIKMENYADIFKLLHVTNEIAELRKLAEVIEIDVSEEVAELKEVNKIIWDNEDHARTYGPNKDYDLVFMTLAAKTYESNTRRAKIKQAINKKCNSNIVETKSYTNGEI
jgi:hypothetical protein